MEDVILMSKYESEWQKTLSGKTSQKYQLGTTELYDNKLHWWEDSHFIL